MSDFLLSKKSLLTLVVFATFLSGCKVYHNTTSRYNSYFLANERMELTEEQIFGEPEETDYSQVLYVYPKLDSVTAAPYKADLEYCIEKASNPVQYHQSSKWVDDCFLIIGKAQLYQGKFTDAAQTFKYVNTKSTDPVAKQTALIYLMRSYIESRQYDNVEFVLDYVKREGGQFNEENARLFYLSVGHYFRTVKNYGMAAAYLERGAPLVKPRRRRARFYYIIGQMYQEIGDNAKAYENYRLALDNVPAYDLEFNAQLNAAQVFDFNEGQSAEETEKYFRNLLRDQKNREFKDRIFYEMAIFEIKKKNYDQAVNYLNQSNGANRKNSRQRAFAYVKLGEIHYQHYKEFMKAAAYYDSAMTFVTEDMEIYDEVNIRASVLKEFSTHYLSAEYQEKMLRLSEMSKDEIIAFFENEIEGEKAAIDIERERQERLRQMLKNRSTVDGKGRKGWYFSNETAVDFGKTYFSREWGDRPLEDNWRRRNKETVIKDDDTDPDADPKEEKDPYADLRSLEDRIAEVPASPKAVEASRGKLREALFSIGKIYYYKLEEPKPAFENLERYLKIDPEDNNRPEALFMLHRICSEQKDCDALGYRSELLEKFEESVYAQTLIKTDTSSDAKPLIADNIINDSLVEAQYAQAYDLYQSNKFKEAKVLTSSLIKKYPNNSIPDKISLLDIMLRPALGGTKAEYMRDLQRFKADFPDSPLSSYADNLIEVAEESTGK